MNRPIHFIVTFQILAALSSCQVAQQAVDALHPQEQVNILKEQDIPTTSSLRPAAFPTIPRHDGDVLAIQAVTGAPTVALSIGKDGRIIGWDFTTGTGHEVKNLQSSPRVAVLGEVKSLVAWSDDQGVFVTCTHGCSQRFQMTKLRIRPTALAFHDGDTTLLIGGGDGRVYRWRFLEEQEATSMEEREKMVERYFGHQSVISGVAGHSVGRAFFSTDWDGALIGWLAYTADDHEGQYDRNTFRGRFYTDIAANMAAKRRPDRGVSALAIAKNGEELAIGTEDGFVEVWHVRGFTMAARQQLHQGRVTSVSLTNEGQRVASVGKDSKVRVSQLIPDPLYTVSATALQNIFQEVSQHSIPAAKGATFVAANRIAVSTTTGELAEISLEEPTAPTPSPTPKRNAPPHVKDTDY